MDNIIRQFSGEDRRDAIINHFGLDIEEESFFDYIEDMGYSIDNTDEVIENLYKMYIKNKDAQ